MSHVEQGDAAVSRKDSQGHDQLCIVKELRNSPTTKTFQLVGPLVSRRCLLVPPIEALEASAAPCIISGDGPMPRRE